MISIFICEDDLSFRKQITECIVNYVQMEDMDMKVVLDTAYPNDILSYLQENTVAGLYFLDLDLGKDEINGIELAQKIRKHDPRGFIVFITSDAASHVLTFRYKVEAMEYVVKGDINLKEHIFDAIHNVYEKYTADPTPLQDSFSIKLTDELKGRTVVIQRSEIIYIETITNSHNIALYTESQTYVFRSPLKDVEKKLDERFFKCHRSFIININKIVAYDKTKKILHLSNAYSVDVASKFVKRLETLVNEIESAVPPSGQEKLICVTS